MIGRSAVSFSSGVCVTFFFQAEDGIRDYKVTGVQTCALPIFPRLHRRRRGDVRQPPLRRERIGQRLLRGGRSEERRVGQSGGARGVTDCGGGDDNRGEDRKRGREGTGLGRRESQSARGPTEEY